MCVHVCACARVCAGARVEGHQQCHRAPRRGGARRVTCRPRPPSMLQCPCCSVLRVDALGAEPTQARPGTHCPQPALGSWPSGRRSCLGLGPQHGPPSSPGLLLSPCLAQTDLARAEGSGLLQQAHREDRRRCLKAPGRPAARRGRELPDGLASVSWRFKASVSAIVRLLGKLWEANLLIHCG